ncbi:MAG: glycosyltransferase [Geobacteraceae bacterium]
MKILFVSNYIPYRADSGITVKIQNLLACMSRVCEVSCVFIVDEREGNRSDLDACRLNVTNHLIELKREDFGIKRYLLHLYRLFAISSRLRDALSDIMVRENPELVWLEFGYLGHFIPFMKRFGVPVVYSSHNSQFSLDWGLWVSNGNLAYKLRMAPFILSYFFHERRYFGLADILLCISRPDMGYYGRLFPTAKLRLLPYLFDTMNLTETSTFTEDHPYLCMVGSLKSYQNYSGVLFALDRVWPILARENSFLRLYIIGELPTEGSQEYRYLRHLVDKSRRVILKGRVESVIPFVKGALASLVPLSIGSGVRTKIIESVVCGTPVVSTTIGAEGLPFVNGESIFIADTAEELAARVLDLAKDARKREKMAGLAYRIYCEELSCDAGRRILAEIFSDLKLQQQ